MDYQTSLPKPATNSMATISMIAGIAGWVLGLLSACGGAVISVATLGFGSVCVAPLGCLTPIGWLVAVVTGHVAKNQLKQSGEGGSGQATAGLIMGYIGLGLTVLVICVSVGLIAFGVLSIPFLSQQ